MYDSITFLENCLKNSTIFEKKVRIIRETDRQTDMTKLIVAFRNSANASKNCCSVGKLKFKILCPILF